VWAGRFAVTLFEEATPQRTIFVPPWNQVPLTEENEGFRTAAIRQE
jgi:hypothetical protein